MSKTPKAAKKSCRDLMELADESEENPSENEEFYDSDMDQGNSSKEKFLEGSEKESGGSEEEDAIDIMLLLGV